MLNQILWILQIGGKSAYAEYVQKNLPVFLFLFNLSLSNGKNFKSS